MKTFAALLFASLCLVCFADDPFTAEEREFFKHLKFDQLPHELQVALHKSTRKGDSSNWCCVNEKPLKTEQHSKVVSHVAKVTSKVKVGYTKCGFLGAGMCATYDVRYQQQVKYAIAYYEAPVPGQCDEVDVRCCKSGVQVAGNCLGLDEATKYMNTLKNLKDGGLLDLVG